MADLPQEPTWIDGIYQLETSDPVLAGPGGIDNRQATQLGNRTAYLKQGMEALAAALAEQGEDSDPFGQYLLREAVAEDAGPLAWLGAAGGTADDLVFVLPEGMVVTAYKGGQHFQFKAVAANTGAVTAKVGELATKAIKKGGSEGLVDLDQGDIKPGVVYSLIYDGVQFQLGGGVGAAGEALAVGSVQWWPNRASIPAGWAPADGQVLSRATFPDLWAWINNGLAPSVAETTWQSTPTERGKYTAGDGATTLRLPDYNGKSAGSLGAPFLRGDGGLAAAPGVIQGDAIRNITGAGAKIVGSAPTGAFASEATTNSPSGSVAGSLLNFDASRVVPTAAENRPLNVAGCWVIKTHGAVANPGSVDAAQLASDYAALVTRVEALESPRPMLHVRDEKPSGTAGGTFTSGAWRTRDLNTVVTNTISEASLNANQITLPAGVYEAIGYAPHHQNSSANSNSARAQLYNVTAGSVLLKGTQTKINGSYAASVPLSPVEGRFTLDATSVLELQHRATATNATEGFGVPAGFGDNEIYSSIIIKKVG